MVERFQTHEHDSLASGRLLIEAPASQSWWQKPLLWNALLAWLLFALALVTYLHGNETTNFHQDESRWLNRAHYFTDTLDPFGPTWEDQYLTRGQPPVGSYVMGLGLLLQGRDMDTNLAWDFRRAWDFNIKNGMYPEHDDLIAGRRTNNVLGAIAVAVVFVIVTQLTNTLGGIVGSLLLIANPLQIWHNRLALADTTLTLTLALLVLCTIQLMRRPGWGWAISVGVLVGLGGANKFTPLALCAPLMALGGLLLIRDWWSARGLRGAKLAGWHGIPPLRNVGWMLLSTPITAGATFVAVYPYLWSDPIGRALVLLRFRQSEMAAQARINPDRKINDAYEAARRTWTLLGDQWSGTQSFFQAIDLPTVGRTLSQLDVWLAMIGFVVLAFLALRKGVRSPHFVVWLLIVTESATIIATMRTDFERYYLPIVLGFVIASGVAAGFFGEVLWKLIARNQRPTRSDPVTTWTVPVKSNVEPTVNRM